MKLLRSLRRIGLACSFASLVSALASAIPAIRTVPAGDTAPEAPPAALAEVEPPATRLGIALDAVQTESICADIRFIAADELEGRYTPSPGLRIAARYIRARLQRLGFEPGAADGFFYTYPLEQSSIDDVATGVKVDAPSGEFRLKLGADYFYRSPYVRENADYSGPVVFCGKGTEDDLAEVDLTGAWALVLDSGQSSDRRSRSRTRDGGALGTLFFPSADFEGESYAERLGGALQRAREATYRYVSKSTSDEPRMRPHPQIYLTREAGLRLLALASGRPEGAAIADWLPAVGTRLDGTLTDEQRGRPGEGQVLVEDVCGFWRGSDPELWKEVILISAHYDHVGTQNGEICNGADDNGSGTTGLLAVAEALKSYGPLRRSVMLIWVSGEERGLWGSQAWTSSPWLPEGARPVANLNIDMIGRNAPAELYITPSKEHEKHNGIVRTAMQLASLEGFGELGSADDFYHRSDQANFATLDIPVAFLFSGLHEDYHRPTDDAEKIDCDKIRRVARLIVRLVDSFQSDRLNL